MDRVLGNPRRPFRQHRQPLHGFTLIELLVVVAIISLLIGILLPGLSMARRYSASAASLSNLKQLGVGLRLYTIDSYGIYPMHASVSTTMPPASWADYIYAYLTSTEVYMSPLLDADEAERMTKPFAHTVDQSTGADIPGTTVHYGGYGYNFQYLGNARQPGGVATWHNSTSQIQAPANMVAIGDTRGSRNGNASDPYGVNGEAVYVIDPPLGSASLGSNGSRKASATPGAGNAYYSGGSDGDENYRSMPGDRNHSRRINYVFADGHSASMTREEVDQIDPAYPQGNNAYWNGQFDRTAR